MSNPRISAKERGLIKGALRRTFSRSELRRQVLASVEVKGHSDPARPRVKKWTRCAECKKVFPAYQAQVDHLIPVVPVESSLEEMSWDELVNRLWCNSDNLQVLDVDCHKAKCKEENKQRRLHKARRKSK